MVGLGLRRRVHARREHRLLALVAIALVLTGPVVLAVVIIMISILADVPRANEEIQLEPRDEPDDKRTT